MEIKVECCEVVKNGDEKQIRQWIRNHVLRKMGDTWKIIKAVGEKNHRAGLEQGRKEVQDLFNQALNI